MFNNLSEAFIHLTEIDLRDPIPHVDLPGQPFAVVIDSHGQIATWTPGLDAFVEITLLRLFGAALLNSYFGSSLITLMKSSMEQAGRV